MLFVKNIYTVCIFTIFLTVIATATVSTVHALSPTDLIVVYNQNIPGSKDVAGYYASKRSVPLSNLVGVDVTESESIHRADYETKMILPLRNAVKKLQLAGHKPAILLVYGIPLRVIDTSNPELSSQNENLIYGKVSEYKRLVQQQGIQLEMLINKGKATIVTHEKQNIESIQTKEVVKSVKKTVMSAFEYLKNYVPVAAERENFSKVVSLLFRMEGMAPLVHEVKNQIASMDKEERSLFLQKNNLLKFNAVLNSQLTEMQFRGFTPEKALEVSTIIRMVKGVIGELLFWDIQYRKKAGMTSASVDSELTLVLVENFQLSSWLINPFMKEYSKVPGIEFIRRKTIMVSRLDAPSADMAKRMVDDALEIEQSGLTGTVYIDSRGIDDTDKKNSYGRYDKHLRNLHSIIKSTSSLPVVMDNKPELFPEKTCADAAIYVGWYSLAEYVDSFEWKKGAVGFHIASSEASTLRRKGSQVWCKRMIEEGVTATLGPVDEPYLSSFPLPDVFFPLLMTGKLTLLETYFRSIPFLSWRMTLIGDPLYTPFKKTPAINLDSL